MIKKLVGKKKTFKLNSSYISIYATIGLFIVLFLIGSVMFNGFFSGQVLANLFIDNAYLLVLAIGQTFVIIRVE